MWYSGYDGQRIRIGYAISSDGISWIPADTAVLDIGAPGEWDDYNIGGPSIFADDTTYHMWYIGRRSGTGYEIGYATAPVIINVPGDLPTIQAAIDSASDGNIVLVADSTYYENINFKGKAITVASHFIMDGDTNHINNTIIDGSQHSHPDSGSVVYFINGEDTTSVLCGFTITGGTGTFYDASPTGANWRAGGGIYFLNGTGVTIKDNHITGNRISGDAAFGGGIAVNAPQGFLILENNHIFANHATGTSENGRGGGAIVLSAMSRIIGNVFERDTVISAAYAYGGAIDVWTGGAFLADGVIQNNTFRENIAEALATNNGLGGALSMYGTGPITISENIFEGNIAKSRNGWGEGGAILLYDESIPNHGRKLILKNQFIGNTTESQFGSASGGAIEIFRSSAMIDRNLFSDNSVDGVSASYGGAVGLHYSAFQLDNNIMHGNSATSGAGAYVHLPPNVGSGQSITNNTIVDNEGVGIRLYNTDLVLLNTIVWGNSGGAFQNSGGTLHVNYSDVQGTGIWPGLGNINADPLFVPGDSLYHLTDSSLCVNTGIDSIQINQQWYYCPSNDYEGDERPYISVQADMGADETQVPPVGIEPLPSAGIPQSYALEQNYPNPFNPTTTIEFALPHSGFVTLKVYNILGEEVATLISERLAAREYKYDWDASGLASGVYLYRLDASEYQEVKKMVLLK